jgi:hypothetical protein
VPVARLGHATAVLTEMQQLGRLVQELGTVTGSRA